MMSEVIFVARREERFESFPPASAQHAIVLPFYGELTVWLRTPGVLGWHLPTASRRSGETILEVAERKLWESTHVTAPRLDLLGAIRQDGPRPTTAYIYTCELAHLPWENELPEDVEEIGLFKTPPFQMASEWSRRVLDYVLHARLQGLR